MTNENKLKEAYKMGIYVEPKNIEKARKFLEDNSDIFIMVDESKVVTNCVKIFGGK